MTHGYPEGCTGGVPALSRECRSDLTRSLYLVADQSGRHLLVTTLTAQYQQEAQLGNILQHQQPNTVALRGMRQDSDYVFVTSEAEISTRLEMGYVLEPVLGYVFTTQNSDSVALYRLQHPGDRGYYYAAGQAQRNGLLKLGYLSQGILGYISVEAD